jgi:cytohesin
MGQLPTVRKLLATGIDVNASTIGHHGGSALHAAAQGGHIEIVNLLLKAGADPDAESYDGVTPLANVANDDVCKALLSAGADVNHRDHGGCTPLIGAIFENVFRRQVRAGAEMTVVDHRGHGVLLHIARTAERRKAWAVPKALKTDSAFDEGLATIFRRLIRAGVSVNDQHHDDGRTALMLTVSLDLRKTTAALLKAGADPLAEDNDGKTAVAYVKTRSPLRKQFRDAEKK